MQPNTIAAAQSGRQAEDFIGRELAQSIGEKSYHHWFHQKTRLSIQDDELTVGVASPFLLDWLQKQFKDPVKLAAQSALGLSARVRFVVDPEVSLARQQSLAADHQSKHAPKTDVPAACSNGNRPATKRRSRRFADLNDFVTGSCNELAVTAAEQVCRWPAAKFNPLFIHGPVGTGKTHLLEGIYRRLRRRHSNLQVVLLTSEAFTNYFTEALRNHTLPSFRQRFRTVDVLLIDDVDFLDAKRVTQEEFLHTFKQLVSHDRQIVLTSSRHPRLSTKISDELQSRFLSGMVCRVESPDLQTRIEIVRRKAARLSGKFTDEALQFIAQSFRSNVRELEGAVHCLQTYHCMTSKPVGLTAAKRVLADLERDCIRVLRLSDVEEAVCELFGVDSKILKSSKRSRSISQPRMLAMYLARKHTRAAYSEIGGYFGGRNHSTVISAEKKIDGWLKQEASMQIASQTWPIQEILETLEQQLQVG